VRGHDGGPDAETGIRRNPLIGILIKVLPLGFGWPVIGGFCDVTLREPGRPKASGNADCQRAYGNSDHDATPSALPNPTML